MDQILLTQEIDILKNNIQEIIKSKDPVVIKRREEYLKQLDIAAKNLHQIKKEISKNKEIKKVQMTNDSIKYNSVKNKPNSRELMNEIKTNREKAQENFEKIKNIENTYIESEIELGLDTVPGNLFFYKDIKNTYGLCPSIKIEELVKENRLKWLSEQKDSGTLYNNCYNRLFNKSNYNSLIDKLNVLNTDINNIHSEIFSEKQKEIYNDIIKDINEYKECKIKTKKIKDKFKIIINNISILVLETGLDTAFINYLESYFDIVLYSNNIVSYGKSNGILKGNLIFIEVYKQKVEEYRDIKECINVENKYINNTLLDLKTQLNEYLVEQERIENKKKEEIQYVGEYFKKWSLLTEIERLERYDAYATFFVITNLLKCDLIQEDQKETEINKVKELLRNNSKNIKFKNIKWNVTKGIIEKIKILKYDDTKKECFIEISKEEEIKPKKISSIKTILSKQNEKIINEEIIKIIVKNKSKEQSLKIPELKENCIELLKIKLLVKRITSNDKTLIFKKFDDIYSVIMNNESSSN